MRFLKTLFLTTLSLAGPTLLGPRETRAADDLQESIAAVHNDRAERPAADSDRGDRAAIGSERDAPRTTLLEHPLELAVARWADARPRSRVERLADLLAAVAPPRPLPRSERIVLRLESSGETLLTLPRLGPPLVSGVLGELPILGQAWAIANDLVPASSERLRDLTLELGGDSLLPDALRDFGGSLARGPYSRQDDANGNTTTIDVRVVLSWRPRDTVHLEAGYSVAYAGGEYGAQLENQSGRHADFLRHGPWLAFGMDF